MKRKTMVIVSAIGVIAVVSLVLFLRKPHRDLAKLYDFYSVKRMDLSESVDATGTVEALVKKDLYADYEAAVDKINVKPGDYVKKGDILLTLSSSVLKEQWQEADSALKQAQVNLNVAGGQLATEVAINHVSTSNAQQLENDYHQVALSKEQVKQAQQRLDALNTKNDGYYVADNETLFIRAPFNGQVAWVNVGNGDKITPQTVLATVMVPDALGVEAQVDQNDVSIVAPGQKALITGKDAGHTQNTGYVKAISTIGHNDQTSSITGQTATATAGVISFPVKIELGGKTEGLRPGMTVDVTVLANEHAGVLAVPAGSVSHKDGQDWVNIYQQRPKGGKITPVPVVLGIKHGKYWEVKSGLSGGDRVAVLKPVLTAKQGLGVGAGNPGGTGGSRGMTSFGR